MAPSEAISSTRSSVAASKPAVTRTTRPLGSAISTGAVATGGQATGATTRTGRNWGRPGAAGSDGEDLSFQRHQPSCFDLIPSRAAKSSALSPLFRHRSNRFAHTSRVAIGTSSATARVIAGDVEGGHDGVGRVVTP